ncbi:hypothetical protein [Azotobacter chroococcum]|uniref:hypothetical protein n=1 Tax=Azotobacter chroococcum TaxID=353 RepID=UPI0018DFB111|nr:hypothetical protein [Azotobacter chroococcum]
MSEQKKTSDFPSAEFRFFIYDHCNGDFTYYRTPEERDAASDAVIQQYLDDGWDEDVELVVAGEVTAVATKVNVIERPPEDQIDDEGMDEDGRFWGEEHDYCCNYELLPLPAAPGDTAAPEQAEQQSAWVEQIMEQVQVFASAWSLVGGPFDTGDGLKQAKEEKELLRKLLEASR